ncbi:Uncharacterised protein [Bordetella pertussis]|nr:Uncharacterised protein [Bordetella pertussis]CFU92026.1 Uncharacterised protein [Bordetella pertussis]CFW37811.1 Uncharacterised protein [Bordetella pertussis]CPI78847.1 Uncharacterised protein [Bordetella pertussis]CPL55072.1 Uncharacterised protein [Bordetella pertussis]
MVMVLAPCDFDMLIRLVRPARMTPIQSIPPCW